jgi:hypothetical protein
MTLAQALEYLTGLAFVAPGLPLNALLGTALALHTCDAIMCRLFAHNNGYPKNLWTVLGFIAGLWAVAVLIVLPRRAAPPRPPHPFP